MLNIKESRKQKNLLSNLSTAFKGFIDQEKEEILLNEISLGIGNRLAYQKFPGYKWPLWLTDAGDFYSETYSPTCGPLLLNTGFREWQTFTNYLSRNEVKVDRAGMLSGPGNAPWSIEFWYYSNGELKRPQNYINSIKSSRDHESGELIITGKYTGADFTERIAGWRSNSDEAIISYQINSPGNDDVIFMAVRPYTNVRIGGLNSIGYDETGNLVRINGKNLIALESKPDFIETGSAYVGDINCSEFNYRTSVECADGMASMAFGFTLKKGENTVNLRMALNENDSLSPMKIDYKKSFSEFHAFSEMRLNEGLKIEVPDSELMRNFKQSKITLFNNNAADFDETTAGFRNLYFFSYAMNRAGLDDESEKLFNVMLDKLDYNIKHPSHSAAIRASYLLNAFYECYIHKRDQEFLQVYFQTIRKLGEYIYSYSTGIHSLNQFPGSSRMDLYVKEPSESDFIILLSAMNSVSYLSRCMGIFGDEIKFQNESGRIQAIVKNIFMTRTSGGPVWDINPFLVFPENVFTSYKESEYGEFFSGVTAEHYPLFDRLTGIDMFHSLMLLIYFISLRDLRFTPFSKKIFAMIDEFFILPEFMDPVRKRGVCGMGNSKVMAALILVLSRNRLFLDRPDRLELFPIPEKSWFMAGKKIKIEDALTRYGRLSFNVETTETEVKLTFTGLPKFIPSDIMINIPFDTVLHDSDDFILKKKVGDSYIINGWPSVVRFTIKAQA